MQELLLTYETPVLQEWIDYNGHLRDAFYFLIFSYATDSLMAGIGLDNEGRTATKTTLYTLEAHINYFAEAKLNDKVEVRTQLIDHDFKRLHVLHNLYRHDTKQLLAASEQLFINIDVQAHRSSTFAPSVEALIRELFKHHQLLARPDYCGRKVGIKNK